MTAPLTRSDSDRVIGGVCGGIAERTGWSSSAVRLAFVVSCLLPGPQFVIYLVLWALLPTRDQSSHGTPAITSMTSGPAVPQAPAEDRSSMPTVSEVTSQPPAEPNPWLPGRATPEQR